MKKFTFKKNYAEKLFLNIFFVVIFKVNDEYSTKMSWILNAVRNATRFFLIFKILYLVC